MSSELKLTDVVNTEAYPIHERDNPNRTALVDKCKADLDANLYCSIPNFVQPDALAAMVAEATALRPQAHDNCSRRNIYLHREGDDSLPDDHARNMFDASSVRMIACDLIPATSPLKVFYHSQAVKDLIGEIVGEAPLYDNADPYQPANYVYYDEGDQSSWHFDADNSFTVTLMIQRASEGGQFQISPRTRTDDDQNYDHVARFLRGQCDDTIVDVSRDPGELCIFRGCNSAHRVTPTKGDVNRIMGVFVYEREPGLMGDPKVNETIYGPRTIAAAE